MPEEEGTYIYSSRMEEILHIRVCIIHLSLKE
jgi:hypothetical protein